MYRLLQKLKAIKKALRELNKQGFSEIQASDLKAHHKMLTAQELMHAQPGNIQYAAQELEAVKEYNLVHQAYMEFPAQKSKVAWIQHGDENTQLFHQSIRQIKGGFKIKFIVSMMKLVNGRTPLIQLHKLF